MPNILVLLPYKKFAFTIDFVSPPYKIMVSATDGTATYYIPVVTTDIFANTQQFNDTIQNARQQLIEVIDHA